MKRILALGLSALLCASCLAGCSKDKDESKPGAGKVTLKVVTQFGGEDPATPVFEQQIKDWEKKTGNKITNDSTKADNVWKAKVVADLTPAPSRTCCSSSMARRRPPSSTKSWMWKQFSR